MKCDDLLKQMSEYIDGNVAPGVCDELREHLTGCDACRVVVDSIRNTITIYRNNQPVELSPECRRNLRGLLATMWAKKFPQPPT